MYQYKREPLNDDEVNRLTNACDTFPVKGISTRALQSLLGHDRLATTEIYLNLSPEDAIREFLNKW